MAEMMYGSMPIDDGHLMLEKEDVEAISLKDSELVSTCERKCVGGLEILRNIDRWCLLKLPICLAKSDSRIPIYWYSQKCHLKEENIFQLLLLLQTLLLQEVHC